ncbi:methyltransferase domain-containing protein [Leptolyngbyaceae cyanobacterium CCMR0082]|uniref:Methyltransferase domain-containing protein n=2 Tax=Adonisia turfae TaxID=2950184 RepID=A0A6M0S3H8_9CYAN|nr:methyltransferase domain-containing protein [Adonisia turfae]MDV3351641.1 methyltransferase domain-containing protein [Leptothoe sp. LEGE 181152]NEZ55096.1 methyltransferase domain-containing protein [Adonisia turfae CCMR0081]NEZ63089.1 methyltransferase domain-containing protein [Adonisia turfae CCMR0082]
MTMISFETRTDEDELMDDFSITDSRLTTALEQLRFVNRFLGGYGTTMAVLAPWLKAANKSSAAPIRILDLGTGIADFPEYIVRWADQQNPAVDLEIVAIDANPVTVEYANQALAKRLPDALKNRIRVEVADALNLPYDDDEFDVAMGAMFLHHFAEERATKIVKAMQRVSRGGVLINDLHRHPLAYFGIYTLTRLFQASEMMQNDGPISVLRGFRAQELDVIAQKAELPAFTVRWYWPFRWLLTTLKV